MSNHQIVESTEEERKFVHISLKQFNHQQVPFSNPPAVPLCYVVKSKKGKVIGGVNAWYYWTVLFVDELWVADAHRGKDLGTELLAKVETEAKSLGCTLAHLDTLEFQAKDFYLKQGYEIFGVLDDCPQGHQRYYMKKKM